MDDLRIGDQVDLNETDIDKIRKLNNGRWNHLMIELLHGPNKLCDLSETEGCVAGPSGEVHVINRKLLTKYKKSKNFKIGATVEIIRNQKLFKQFMRYDDEISADVKESLGKKVKIVQIFVDGDYGVKYKNKVFIINEKCIKTYGKEPEYSDSSSESEDLNENTTALYFAIYTGNMALVSGLINTTGPNIKIRDSYPLITAAKFGHMHIIKYLIDKKSEVNMKDEEGNTALHCAVIQNNLAICSFFVEHGADVNSLNNYKITPISFAAYKGYTNVLRLLASREEADLTIGNSNDETALHLAIKNSQVECVETLLDIGGCPTAVRKTQHIPFFLAAMQENEKILEVFLKKYGASIVDFQEEEQHCALHWSIMKNRLQCIKRLIEYKANINIQNILLQTPLHFAVTKKSMACVKILVENKAELDLKDKCGQTPLHLGITLCNADIMNKIFPSVKDEEHIQMMKLVEQGCDSFEDIVVYLANVGARLDVKNEDGKSPIEECLNDSLKIKLLAIQDERKRKKASQISLRPSENIIATKSVAEELKELRQTVKKMRDEATCKMCNERRWSTVFGCGHTTCDTCANDLLECRLCSYKIGMRIQIND